MVDVNMRNIFDYKDNFEKYRHVKSVLQYGDKGLCKKPKISVIMPVYGNPKFFTHSYNSVIHQDADFVYEVIVVDNTPLDETKSDILELIEESHLPNVFYYRNEQNIGMVGNWNRGIELARAELLTYCHDDDMLFPNCLSTLWRMHLRYAGKFIIPNCKIIDETVVYPLQKSLQGVSRKEKCVPFGKIDIFMGNPSNGVGCLFYKKDMMEIGGYSEEYYPSMDNALHAKYVFAHGAFRYLQPLYCYRISSSNESNNVYKGFIDNGLFYCECMSRRLGLPSFITKALIHVSSQFLPYCA